MEEGRGEARVICVPWSEAKWTQRDARQTHADTDADSKWMRIEEVREEGAR